MVCVRCDNIVLFFARWISRWTRTLADVKRRSPVQVMELPLLPVWPARLVPPHLRVCTLPFREMVGLLLIGTSLALRALRT